jgi:hypothetical protein
LITKRRFLFLIAFRRPTIAWPNSVQETNLFLVFPHRALNQVLCTPFIGEGSRRSSKPASGHFVKSSIDKWWNGRSNSPRAFCLLAFRYQLKSRSSQTSVRKLPCAVRFASRTRRSTILTAEPSSISPSFWP